MRARMVEISMIQKFCINFKKAIAKLKQSQKQKSRQWIFWFMESISQNSERKKFRMDVKSILLPKLKSKSLKRLIFKSQGFKIYCYFYVATIRKTHPNINKIIRQLTDYLQNFIPKK